MKQHPVYTVDYFINLYEPIPEDKWMEGTWEDGNGRRCAGGHCGMNMETSGDGKTVAFKKWNALHELIMLLPLTYTDCGLGIAMVNDGKTNQYQQPTPKQRILAALYDIRAMIELKEQPIKAHNRIGSAPSELTKIDVGDRIDVMREKVI